MILGFLIPSFGAYIIFITVYNEISWANSYLTLGIMNQSCIFYLGLFISILSMSAIDFTMF